MILIHFHISPQNHRVYSVTHLIHSVPNILGGGGGGGGGGHSLFNGMYLLTSILYY